MCHMAGTMKFSEVPPYPYTCRSLHRVRTGKIAGEATVRNTCTNVGFRVVVQQTVVFGIACAWTHGQRVSDVVSVPDVTLVMLRKFGEIDVWYI